VALFRKKSKDDGADTGGEAKVFTPQPDKAAKWFEHAKTAAMSSSYDYALSCYANGIKFDPEPMSRHEAMYAAALQYAARGGKPATSKEIKNLDDGTPVGRFAAAEFAWMKNVNDGAVALKAVEAAIKAEQFEFAHWASGPSLALLRRAKKPSKSLLLTAKDLFSEVGAWNEAIVAGELALQLDPNDNELAAALKDLAAQRAMDQGGYAAAGGEEGGFRKFIRDADRQQELVESEAIAGGSTVEERNLLRAQQAFEENPRDPDTINRYAQLLKKQGTPDAVKQARAVFMQGFETVGEYRFRMAAGNIDIENAERRVKVLTEKIKSNGENAEIRAKLDDARRALRDLQASEYRERVAKYPTDRPAKYLLGLVEFELGKLDAAMECFQKAKDEPKLRVRAGHMLGRCFAQNDWHSEAIAEYREALGVIDATEEDRELDIRYDLMLSLIEHAREERSVDLAREAREICSSITRKDISYRDIRERRKEVDELIKSIGE
jgi:tetratricopeptide (TPR) repeat protein